MVCNSLECIHGDFHSLVFPGTDLEKRQGNDDWIWRYGDNVYFGIGAYMEVMDFIRGLLPNGKEQEFGSCISRFEPE